MGKQGAKKEAEKKEGVDQEGVKKDAVELVTLTCVQLTVVHIAVMMKPTGLIILLMVVCQAIGYVIPGKIVRMAEMKMVAVIRVLLRHVWRTVVCTVEMM